MNIKETYYDNGALKSIEFYNSEGQLHRIDKPALELSYDKMTGTLYVFRVDCVPKVSEEIEFSSNIGIVASFDEKDNIIGLTIIGADELSPLIWYKAAFRFWWLPADLMIVAYSWFLSNKKTTKEVFDSIYDQLIFERLDGCEMFVSHPNLPVHGYGSSREEAIESFLSMLEFQYEDLVECDQAKLTEGGLKRRKELIKVYSKVSQ